MRTALSALVILTGAAACNDNSTRTDGHPPAVVTTAVSVSVRPTVVWPAKSTIDEGALVSLTGETLSGTDVRALIARSPVPVLAPGDRRLATPTLVVEGEYFALTGRADGATISLQGTRAAHRYEGVEPIRGNRDLRGAKGFVSVNEGIRTASWIENGAAYSVDVECSDHRDARCQSDEFLVSIVTQLTYIGGSER